MKFNEKSGRWVGSINSNGLHENKVKKTINKSLYMKAMNMIREDCEKCPARDIKEKCPSEMLLGDIIINGAHLPTCTKTMYDHLIKKEKRNRKRK